jgi:hypothetical protein
MNFFKRRKILKKANFLDLTPVRRIGEEPLDETRISLLMPRFKNKYSSAMFQPRSKDHFIRIKLDAFGSMTWMLIDGQTTVAGIAEELNISHPDKLQPAGETPERVTKFLAMLYQQRYISFREIMDREAAK